MQHRFDIGTSKTGWPQYTLVIEVEKLTPKSLGALAKYVTNNIHFAFEKDNSMNEDSMWPLAIETADELMISEAVFWAMVSESLPDAKTLVIDYLQTLCRLAERQKYNQLLMSDEYHYMGAFALKPFLDWYFEQDESRTEAAQGIYQCFFDFVKSCDQDMGHFTQEYIEKVIVRLRFFNKNAFVHLFCFQLCNSQFGDKEFRYLYQYLNYRMDKPGFLKEVIDHLTDVDNKYIDDDYRENEDIYLRLCAAIYGNNLEETTDVLDYVSGRINKKLMSTHPRLLVSIQRVRDECDVFRQHQPTSAHFLNSSFHLYDQKNKKWLPLE